MKDAQKTYPLSRRSHDPPLPKSAQLKPITHRRISFVRVQGTTDPHRSPLWIKTLGLPLVGAGTRPLAHSSPGISSVPIACSSVSRERLGLRQSSPVFTDRWSTAPGRLQPLGGSGQGRISQNLLSTAMLMECLHFKEYILAEKSPR